MSSVVRARTSRLAMRKPSARLSGSDGFTLIEVIFVAGLIAVLSGIAVPALLRSRAAANETTTVGTLRVVHSAQLMYSLTCGIGMYAASLPALVGAPGEEAFLPADLTAGLTPSKSGYDFTLVEGPSGLNVLTDCNGAQTASDYYLTAEPVAFGQTGNRAFASDEMHVIWQDTTGVPPIEPFTPSPTVMPIQ